MLRKFFLLMLHCFPLAACSPTNKVPLGAVISTAAPIPGFKVTKNKNKFLLQLILPKATKQKKYRVFLYIFILNFFGPSPTADSEFYILGKGQTSIKLIE